MASRTRKNLGVAAIIGAIVVAGLLGVLIVGVGVSWLMSEPSSLKGEAIGIAMIDGTPTVVSCRTGGIGTAQVVAGGSPDSPPIWRATTTGIAAATVPIAESVQGYDIQSNAVVVPGTTYSLSDLTSGTGVNNLGSIVPFDPGDIPEGNVLTGDGKTMSMPEFVSRTTGCVLS